MTPRGGFFHGERRRDNLLGPMTEFTQRTEFNRVSQKNQFNTDNTISELPYTSNNISKIQR